MDELAVFEVRYDDDESYHVAARFTDEGAAVGLRDRLAAAHTAADGDGCHLDSSWVVIRVAVNALIDEGFAHIAALMREVPSWKPAYYGAEVWLREVPRRVARLAKSTGSEEGA